MTEKWVMPEWMELYRTYLDRHSGGNTIENLMNDHHTTAFSNSIRVAIICGLHSQISLLEWLKKDGLLKEVEQK